MRTGGWPRGGWPAACRCLIGLLGLLGVVLAPHLAGASSGREVIAEVIARKTPAGLSATVEMILTGGERGKRKVRTLALFRQRSRGTTRTIMFVRSPRALRNTATLAFDQQKPGKPDEQWFYRRRSGKVLAIEGAARNGGFLDSDFSFFDLTLPDPDAFVYKLLDEPEVDGMATWQIQALPKNGASGESAGYAKSVLWVRKDNFVVVRALHWLHGGRTIKHLRVTGLEEFEGRWVVTEQRMATLEGRRTLQATVLRLSKISLDATFKRGLFKPERLKRGLK